MGIHPIDLQTLYTQLEKIGKSQVQQQQATQAAREAEMTANRQKAAENLEKVQETDTDDGRTGVVHDSTSSVTDRNAGSGHGEAPGRKPGDSSGEPDSEAPPPEKEIITDPALGRNIDISG